MKTGTIKFNRYNVTNGTEKARVFYSINGRIDGKDCVTLYSKDYGYSLGKIIPNGYKNDTDSMTDYFDKGQVNIFADNPLYAAALARAEQVNAEQAAKRASAQS